MMYRPSRLSRTALWLLASMSAVGLSTPAVRAAENVAGDASRIDFNQQIRPILADYCFACHGPDEKKRKADLRLDTKQGAFAELDDQTLADAFESAPSVELTRGELDAGLGLLELMVHAGAAKSNGEARRLIDQGGVSLNNVRRDDSSVSVTPADLASETTLVLRVGKKRYFLVRFV